MIEFLIESKRTAGNILHRLHVEIEFKSSWQRTEMNSVHWTLCEEWLTRHLIELGGFTTWK